MVVVDEVKETLSLSIQENSVTKITCPLPEEKRDRVLMIVLKLDLGLVRSERVISVMLKDKIHWCCHDSER